MFSNQGNLTYKKKDNKNSFPIRDLEDGVNFTKEFIIYKDEELIRYILESVIITEENFVN